MTPQVPLRAKRPLSWKAIFFSSMFPIFFVWRTSYDAISKKPVAICSTFFPPCFQVTKTSGSSSQVTLL